jgi:hypothetical protein
LNGYAFGFPHWQWTASLKLTLMRRHVPAPLTHSVFQRNPGRHPTDTLDTELQFNTPTKVDTEISALVGKLKRAGLCLEIFKGCLEKVTSILMVALD